MGLNYVDTIVHGMLHSKVEIEEEEGTGNVLKFELLAHFEGSYKLVDVILCVPFAKEERSMLKFDKEIYLAGRLEPYMDTTEDGTIYTKYTIEAQYIAYDILKGE